MQRKGVFLLSEVRFPADKTISFLDGTSSHWLVRAKVDRGFLVIIARASKGKVAGGIFTNVVFYVNRNQDNANLQVLSLPSSHVRQPCAMGR